MSNLDLIKKLRENTGCGIADCSKALASCNDSYDEAIDWLRKKGLSSAAKKSSRSTTEGLIGVALDDSGKLASIVEVNSETDFVARNDRFQELVTNTARVALGVSLKNKDEDENKAYVEAVLNQTLNDKKIADEFTDSIAAIGENLQLRRGRTIRLEGNGLIVPYLHNALGDHLGKIGVLVALKSDADTDILEDFGKKIAMHVAAMKPEFLDRTKVSTDRLEREKSIFMEQSKNSGKPQNIIEKMIDGRLKKFYEENCLLDQGFVMDDKVKISELLKSFEKETGKSVEIQDFALFILGEGLEKQVSDFASEVNSMVKK